MSSGTCSDPGNKEYKTENTPKVVGGLGEDAQEIAKNFNFDLTMIHTAGHIENLMAHRMTIKINSALNRQQKPVNGSKILFLGVAYKPDIEDERESPALKIMDEVVKKKGEMMYHDPLIPSVTIDEGRRFESVELTDALLTVDLRNMVKAATDKVYKL